jgi:predicted HTH transcriptional regulator
MSQHFLLIEFMLDLVWSELKTISSGLKRKKLTFSERIKRAGEHFKNAKFTRKDYMNIFKDISTATASRDLKGVVEKRILQKEGDKSLAFYIFADN